MIGSGSVPGTQWKGSFFMAPSFCSLRCGAPKRGVELERKPKGTLSRAFWYSEMSTVKSRQFFEGVSWGDVWG